ncbi:MAG: PHP domain-containing protein, partial [Chloroflexi bacterium]|nr:PHP domain-containing protein [Chloroflexota bacterium]
MVQPAYVELHAHSAYSFLNGVAVPDDLVLSAAELGYPALALTDHDGLYGAMEFTKKAHELGIKPILGAEITMEGGAHLVLLAETAQGYAHLCRLISHARMTHKKDEQQLDWATLREYAGGLIALSGCERGEIPALIAAGRWNEAEAAARRCRDIFGPRHFFLELQQHYVYGDTARNAALVELAGHLGLPYVATNNVHYPERAQWRLHDAVTAIRHRLTLDTSHRERRANDEFSMKAPQQMAELFAKHPQAIANTLHIANRCEFDLRKLAYEFPDFTTPDGSTPDAYLEAICRKEAAVKYSTSKHAHEVEGRLQDELRLIRLHKLTGFFLINHSLIEYAHNKKMSARGRGSSVSSLVCYLLGLSGVDPLEYELSVGRFLNESLKSVPDIDLDFSRDARVKMMKYVYEKYGPDRAGLVCTFPTYRIRSAIRDLGKVLGLPEAQLDKLAKLSDNYDARSLREQMGLIPDFRSKTEAPLWRDLVDMASQIA